MDDDNPFSPGYGETPPYLAGRDEVINTAIVALRRGPGRAQFHQFLIGPRGCGKTTTLNAITELAAGEHGAVGDPLDRRIPAPARCRHRWRRRRRATAPIAMASRRRTARRVGHRRRARRRLRHRPPAPTIAGRTSRRSPSSNDSPPSPPAVTGRVIIWVDEAQAARPDEIAVLATVMQELANVRRLPVAVWAAGLPDTRTRWIDAASPLERQHFTILGNLDPDATAAALEIPLHEAGRRIDPDALDLLVAGVGRVPLRRAADGCGRMGRRRRPHRHRCGRRPPWRRVRARRAARAAVHRPMAADGTIGARLPARRRPRRRPAPAA